MFFCNFLINFSQLALANFLFIKQYISKNITITVKNKHKKPLLFYLNKLQQFEILPYVKDANKSFHH